MQYNWRNFSFEAPDAEDETTVLLVDGNEPPEFNLTVRIDSLPGGSSALESYAAEQSPPAGAVLESKSERKVAGKSSIVFEYHLSTQGITLRQQQALVPKDDSVVVFTCTFQDSAEDKGRAIFDRALETFAWGDA